MMHRATHTIRLAQPLVLALLLAACGADGEPEAPERLDSVPSAAPVLAAPVRAR
jgi:hypothetical protein